MKQDIKLFIDNKQVDFAEDLSIPFTYQLEDLNNPTIVKNSFTKTIKLKGTDNNNQIFGEIYNLDRKQLYDTNYVVGAYFDPSKRTPFQLFRNSDLIESGYMQLNNISIKNKVINYEITLYGGLGDFFYNLMYNSNGEKLTLADLRYFVRDGSGHVLPSDQEFDFDLNQDIVYNCFNDVNGDGNELQNFVTFVPSYNGLYDNFDNETCLINTNRSVIFKETEKTDNETTYTTYNGFALGKLNKAYTEWEIRDLRSYMQRPAIKLQKIIETICRPENNGGYTVKLDNSFFNNNNPYWSKSYIALPLFNNNDDEVEEKEGSSKGKLGNDSGIEYTFNRNLTADVGLNSEVESVTYYSGVIDYSTLPKDTSIDITLNFSLYFDPNAPAPLNTYYLSAKENQGGTLTAGYNPVFFNVVITDENNKELYKAATPYRFEGGKDYAAYPNSNYNYVYGRFEKVENQLWYYSYDDNANTFSFQYKNIASPSQKIRIQLQANWSNQAGYLYTGTTVNYYDNSKKISGLMGVDVDPNSTISFNYGGTVKTNTVINKRKLLKTENSPADYLLDYCKIFGLYFSKDLYSKTITISTRNNFFKNKIVDWSNKIDWSKDFKIDPILFDKKFYSMSTKTPETYFSKKYKNEYQIEYGQQRLDTKYNFNNESNNLYQNNIFENVISCQDRSIYFRNFYNSEHRNVPAFLSDNIEYQLFANVGTDDEKEISIDYYGSNFIDLPKTVNWSNKSGYDVMAKTCFYNLENNEPNLSDISNTLLLFNGYVDLKDNEGNPINYWLTDDLIEMKLLNDENCYIYTEYEYDLAGKRIAHKITKLPQFLRYNIDKTGNVVTSLDFGLPREIYINNITYNTNSTIYNNYWKNYYTDQFSIDTKKITCYVNLQDELKVNEELLRQFYYFNNSYWLLNKIDSYDVNSNATTKCEFIKVQDTANYLYGQLINS